MSGAETLIVGAAPVAERAVHYTQLIRTAGFVVAADGGLELCLAAGRVPDVCVGDFDSAPPGAVGRAEQLGAAVRRYPGDKDVTDLDLALRVARESGRTRVTFTAAFAGRLDHTLAALGTLVAAADVDAVADEPEWLAIPLDASCRPVCVLAALAGTVISVLALGGQAVASARGLAYPMRDMVLSPLASTGVSNVATDAAQTVSLSSGTALVIVNRGVGTFTLQSLLARTDNL